MFILHVSYVISWQKEATLYTSWLTKAKCNKNIPWITCWCCALGIRCESWKAFIFCSSVFSIVVFMVRKCRENKSQGATKDRPHVSTCTYTTQYNNEYVHTLHHTTMNMYIHYIIQQWICTYTTPYNNEYVHTLHHITMNMYIHKPLLYLSIKALFLVATVGY